jgi:HD-like signal output (HDOD) protein
VLPIAVLNLLRLFGKDNVSSRELAKTIGDDAGLATKILKIASSPQFGTGTCKNIDRAIGLIGSNRMKQMAVSLGYEQFS